MHNCKMIHATSMDNTIREHACTYFTSRQQCTLFCVPVNIQPANSSKDPELLNVQPVGVGSAARERSMFTSVQPLRRCLKLLCKKIT